MEEIGQVQAFQPFSTHCSLGRPARFVCAFAACQKSSFTCGNQECQCGDEHQNCQHLNVKKLHQRIQKKLRAISPQAFHSFEAIDKIIVDLIKELTDLREKLSEDKATFGLRPNTSLYLKYVNAGEINQISGKLVQKTNQQLLEWYQCGLMSQLDISRAWEAQEKPFKQMCQAIRDLSIQRINQSKIVKQFNKIDAWIQQTMESPVKSHKLLYRASDHQFRVDKFHELCDEFPNSLVILKTEFKKIIGGFSPSPWNAGNSYVSQEKSFLFSISMNEKMSNLNTGMSIHCRPKYGPTFGGGPNGHDLTIHDRADQNNDSYAAYPQAYNANGKYTYDQSTHILFSGQTNGTSFKIKEWEVYQITF